MKKLEPHTYWMNNEIMVFVNTIACPKCKKREVALVGIDEKYEKQVNEYVCVWCKYNFYKYVGGKRRAWTTSEKAKCVSCGIDIIMDCPSRRYCSNCSNYARLHKKLIKRDVDFSFTHPKFHTIFRDYDKIFMFVRACDMTGKTDKRSQKTTNKKQILFSWSLGDLERFNNVLTNFLKSRKPKTEVVEE